MATTAKKNIPALRFSEFKGEWEEKRLEDISRKISDGIHTTPIYSENGAYYFINGNNLVDGKVVLYDKTKKVEQSEFVKHKKELGESTLLLSINGTIGSVAYYNSERVVLGKSVCYINLRENISKELIFNFLQTHKALTYFDSELTGTTIKNLSLSSIKNLVLFIPSSNEQKKIASFLSSVDERLQQLQQQQSLVEQYKNGCMQQLFSQKLRFKSDRGKAYPDWKEKELGTLGNTYNGLTGKTKENFGKGKPYIQYKQVFDNTRIDISRFDYVEIDNNENQNTVKYGDILFTVSSETPEEVGMSSVLLDEISELYLNSFCFGYRPNSLQELLPQFAQFLFRTEGIRLKIQKLAQGSTRYNMSKNQLMKLAILLPSLEEQTKIANFLSAIDEQINTVKQQIAQTQQFKKGLLQQMFV